MSNPDYFVTPEGRLSFPALFEAKPVMKGDPDAKVKYQMTLLLPPDADLAPFQKAVKAAVKEKWGDKVKKLPAKNSPIKDAGEKSHLEGYNEDWHYISVKSDRRPAVVDQKNIPVDDPERVYAGMWVRCYVNAFAWDHPASGKGVSFGLAAVQLVRDDEGFGGSSIDTTNAFRPIAAGDDNADGAEDDEDDEYLFS